jgi:hypothetical protein
MGISWDWASNIWLWVLVELSQGPVVVKMGRECAVGVRIPWDWTSNVWLWILIELGKGPVVVEVR